MSGEAGTVYAGGRRSYTKLWILIVALLVVVVAVVAVDATKLSAALAGHRQTATAAQVRLAAPSPRLEAKGDASFISSTAGVDRTAGRPGWALDPATAATAVEAAVRSGAGAASVNATTTRAATEPASLAGVDQLIGTFTTDHPCRASRVTNIHLIAQIVDGTVIAPGATFSLNERVGKRTAAKGFVPAPAIVASVTGAHDPVGADGGFRIRVVRTVYDDGHPTGTTTLRWTYDGLD